MEKNIKEPVNWKKGWSVVFGYLLSYKKEVAILSIAAILYAILEALIPLITGRFFDSLISASEIQIYKNIKSVDSWKLYLSLFVFLQLISHIVLFFSSRMRGALSTKIHGSYVVNSTKILLELPLSFHKSQKIGEIGEKISRASNWLFNIIQSVIIDITPKLLAVIFSFAVVIHLFPLFAIVIGAGVVLFVTLIFGTVRRTGTTRDEMNEAYSKAWGNAYDARANVEVVKQAGAENYEFEKLSDAFINKAGELWDKIKNIYQKISLAQNIVILITRTVIFIFSVDAVSNGVITIGELIAINGYAAMAFGPFVQFANEWDTIQTGVSSVEQAERILTLQKEIYSPENAVKIEKIKDGIEFHNVQFSYPASEDGKEEPEVLSNINLNIKKGEVVALVGKTGAGKSSLINLISGYYFPNSGDVTIDGVSTRQLDLRFLRKMIATVPQEIVLFNDTIKNNIKYGSFEAGNEEIERVAKEANVDEFVQKFPNKYEQLVGERGVKLSVGQKQRVAIARAMLRDPEILILDEPTSALDIETERFISDSFEKLMQGRTTLIIAHRLSTVRKANKILVIDNGTIAEEGIHDELIKKENGIYRKFYEMHIGLY